MVSVQHLGVQYGGRRLFEDVSFVIGPHDRVGVVGANGAGKSTLLRIVAGIAHPDTGFIGRARYVTVGYLPQDGVSAKGMTLYEEVETAFEDILLVQQEMDEAHGRLGALDSRSDEYRDTLEVFGELQHKMEDLDAFRMKSKIERVLMGLGFAVGDFNRRTEEFSGGWQMRIELARLLLREPSVLLLDEPTNHLDLDSLQWLENYLRSYNGAVVLVSHDRAFLDGLTSRTLSIGMGKVEEYAGNYSFHVKEREVRKELLLNAYRNQQQKIKQTETFIERFRYKATKARQVQSRIRQLEKMDLIDIEPEEEEIRFEFPVAPLSGRIVLSLKNAAKSYGSVRVFEDLNHEIERGDRIAVVGVNGAGKSTFARLLAGVEPLTKGERVLGYGVVPTYFAQHQAEELDMTKEVLRTVEEVAVGDIRTRLRSILGSFLFHGDDVFKKVGVLSGGEKSRLALAKMLLQPSNFLIMDEPTNHLDMRSKSVLQEALTHYRGTFVVVSHDRAFLDPLVTKVLEISRGGARTFLGNVSAYIDKRRSEAETAAVDSAAGIRDQVQKISERERRRIEAERRQELSRKLQPLRSRLSAIEHEIARTEERKRQIETAMAAPEFYKNGAEAKIMSAEYKTVQTALSRLLGQWTSLSEEIDRAAGG